MYIAGCLHNAAKAVLGNESHQLIANPVAGHGRHLHYEATQRTLAQGIKYGCKATNAHPTICNVSSLAPTSPLYDICHVALYQELTCILDGWDIQTAAMSLRL